MTVIVDLRKYSISQAYLTDLAISFEGKELVATTAGEHLTEFSFTNTDHAKAFRTALDSTFLLGNPGPVI